MTSGAFISSTGSLPGTFVAVVGPSGAGKDSLISYAQGRLAKRPDIHFVRRLITRDGDAGGEDHLAVTSEDFEDMREKGGFAVHWDAHGLRYGIPASVNDELARGHIIVANGSRSALNDFAEVFPRLLVVNVVARADILAHRLQQRGRETEADVGNRLERGSLAIPEGFRTVTIDNSGALADAGERLTGVLVDLLSERTGVARGSGWISEPLDR